MDLNDVTYDAFLANDRTLDDPQVVDVEKNAEVRLRIINAAASTNFTIDFGGIEATLVTRRRQSGRAVKVRQLPLAVAQRADIVLRMPADGAAVPVFARRGRKLRTGIILRPPGAAIARLRRDGSRGRALCRADFESRLRPRNRFRQGRSTTRFPST